MHTYGTCRLIVKIDFEFPNFFSNHTQVPFRDQKQSTHLHRSCITEKAINSSCPLRLFSFSISITFNVYNESW